MPSENRSQGFFNLISIVPCRDGLHDLPTHYQPNNHSDTVRNNIFDRGTSCRQKSLHQLDQKGIGEQGYEDTFPGVGKREAKQERQYAKSDGMVEEIAEGDGRGEARIIRDKSEYRYRA